MNFIRKWFHRLWYLVWYLFAALVVFLAALFGLVRLLLPLVDDYNQDIENYASRLIERPIKIMSLDAEWHGFSPSLVLNNVRLLSKDGSQTLMALSRARLDFDLIAIAKTGNVQFKRFALSGADLSIVRRETGEVTLSGFESNRLEMPAERERGLIMQWLLSQGAISLHADNLIYNDLKAAGARYHLSNVSLVLRNRGDRHLIDGAIRLPQQANEEFLFSLDITGDITRGGQWSGEMYFTGANIDIRRTLGVLGARGHRVSAGKSNFEIWSEWRNASLVALQGDLSLEEVTAQTTNNYIPILQPLLPGPDRPAASLPVTNSHKTHKVAYDNMIGRFRWEKNDKGWQLTADRFVLTRNKRVWPTSQFSVRYLKGADAAPQFDLRASLIRIDDLVPLIPVMIGDYQGYATLISRLSPQGDMRNLSAQWSGESQRYVMAGRIEKMAFEPVDKFPGYRGLTGEIRLDNSEGSITIDTGKGEFSYPRMFRWDIPIEQFQGQVTWRNDQDALRISSRGIVLNTAHAKSAAVLDLEIPKQKGAPFISLIMNVHDGDGSKASYYFPVSIMNDKTVKWLDMALVQGRVTSGGAIIYGPLDQFPFTEGQGVFDVRFTAEDAILDYAEEWPQIHHARADVVFRGSSLSVTSDSANIFNSTLSNVNVAIENLREKPLMLSIAGRVSGKSQEKLNYLMVSPPLNRMYGQYLRDLKVSGESALDLNIKLKFEDGVQSTVNGDLSLADNSLETRAIPGLLSNVNGKLQISSHGLNAEKIQANLLDQPGLVAVKTVSTDASGSRDIMVSAAGEFDARALSQQRLPVMKDLVNGRSAWQAALTIPGGGDTPNKRNVRVSLITKLNGVEVNLPPPFTKGKADTRVLEVLMDIRDAQRMLLKVSYADRFAGIFDYDASNPWWVTRGDVRFGGGPVVLPGTNGLRVAGHMEELSVDIWKSLIEQALNQFRVGGETAAGEGEGKTAPHMALIGSVDLLIDKFKIFGQQARNFRLRIENKGQWLVADIDSKQVAGSISVPANLEEEPLRFDMRHMHLASVEAGGKKPDPRDLPAIVYNSQSFTYDNKKLGTVAFETAKAENGLLLDQLIVRPSATTVKGHGKWLVEDGQDRSEFELVLDSHNLGKTMKDLGYVNTIKNGNGKIAANLKWPGPLIDPDLYHINGDVQLDFKNGRILDIEPGGAARLFGLFSLQTLPRRLTLDFSDIFGKGLGFDSIHGEFKIEDGDAYTNNFKMAGPSADVSLRGRIGIGAQDYDQKIRVTPHITDTTILLSIVTSQPLLFFFQQLLKEDFDKAASFEYSLNGSWDNYRLEPILKKAPVEPETDGF